MSKLAIALSVAGYANRIKFKENQRKYYAISTRDPKHSMGGASTRQDCFQKNRKEIAI